MWCWYSNFLLKFVTPFYLFLVHRISIHHIYLHFLKCYMCSRAFISWRVRDWGSMHLHLLDTSVISERGVFIDWVGCYFPIRTISPHKVQEDKLALFEKVEEPILLLAAVLFLSVFRFGTFEQVCSFCLLQSFLFFFNVAVYCSCCSMKQQLTDLCCVHRYHLQKKNENLKQMSWAF